MQNSNLVMPTNAVELSAEPIVSCIERVTQDAAGLRVVPLYYLNVFFAAIQAMSDADFEQYVHLLNPGRVCVLCAVDLQEMPDAGGSLMGGTLVNEDEPLQAGCTRYLAAEDTTLGRYYALMTFAELDDAIGQMQKVHERHPSAQIWWTDDLQAVRAAAPSILLPCGDPEDICVAGLDVTVLRQNSLGIS